MPGFGSSRAFLAVAGPYLLQWKEGKPPLRYYSTGRILHSEPVTKQDFYEPSLRGLARSSGRVLVLVKDLSKEESPLTVAGF